MPFFTLGTFLQLTLLASILSIANSRHANVAETIAYMIQRKYEHPIVRGFTDAQYSLGKNR